MKQTQTSPITASIEAFRQHKVLMVGLAIFLIACIGLAWGCLLLFTALDKHNHGGVPTGIDRSAERTSAEHWETRQQQMIDLEAFLCTQTGSSLMRIVGETPYEPDTPHAYRLTGQGWEVLDGVGGLLEERAYALPLGVRELEC